VWPELRARALLGVVVTRSLRAAKGEARKDYMREPEELEKEGKDERVSAIAS